MNERLRLRPVVNESGIEIRPVYTAGDVESSGGFGFVGELLAGQREEVRELHRAVRELTGELARRRDER